MTTLENSLSLQFFGQSHLQVNRATRRESYEWIERPNMNLTSESSDPTWILQVNRATQHESYKWIERPEVNRATRPESHIYSVTHPEWTCVSIVSEPSKLLIDSYHYCRTEDSSSSTVAFAILVKVNIPHIAPQVEFADVHSTQSLIADGTIRLSCNIAVT